MKSDKTDLWMEKAFAASDRDYVSYACRGSTTGIFQRLHELTRRA